jgi:hypothetical protein
VSPLIRLIGAFRMHSRFAQWSRISGGSFPVGVQKYRYVRGSSAAKISAIAVLSLPPLKATICLVSLISETSLLLFSDHARAAFARPITEDAFGFFSARFLQSILILPSTSRHMCSIGAELPQPFKIR